MFETQTFMAMTMLRLRLMNMQWIKFKFKCLQWEDIRTEVTYSWMYMKDYSNHFKSIKSHLSFLVQWCNERHSPELADISLPLHTLI